MIHFAVANSTFNNYWLWDTDSLQDRQNDHFFEKLSITYFSFQLGSD